MMAPTSLKTGLLLLLLLLPQLRVTWAMALAPRQQVSCTYETAASAGDTCQSFSAEWGLPLQTFESLNPGVTCPNLVAGQNYCVVGTVSSAPTTTTSPPLTTTSTPSLTSSTTSAPDQPQQTGTAANCSDFYLVQSGDQCGTIETQFGISASEFLGWNPSVNSGKSPAFHRARCTNLVPGYYYCVGVPSASKTTTAPPTTTTPADGITTPTPYQSGMATNCNSFHLVVTGDQCGAIATAAGISLANFYAWNPAVGSTCATLDLGDYVCIGTLTCTSASVLLAPTQYSSTCGPIGYSHDSPTSLLIVSYTSGPYVASAAACGAQCLATPNCTNLYFIEGSYCNLHQGTSTFETSTSGGYEWFEASCFSSGEACGSYGFSHDASSTLIKAYTSGSSQVASAAACGAECFSTSTCTNVYFIQGSNCNLHFGAFSFAESTSSDSYSWYPLDCFVCSAST